MVTQLLFGEHFKILEEKESWLRIQHAYDKYECWIDEKQCLKINRENFKQLNESPKTYSSELIQLIENKEENTHFPIVIGTSLPLFKNTTCFVGEKKYNYEGQTTKKISTEIREQLLDFAFMYLNAPYLWGGRTPLGIDCSGFTQMVYKLCGLVIPRDAYQQAKS